MMNKEETLNAKNKAVEILEEAKKNEREREDQSRKMEQRMDKCEEMIDKKMEDLLMKKLKIAYTDKALEIFGAIAGQRVLYREADFRAEFRKYAVEVIFIDVDFCSFR